MMSSNGTWLTSVLWQLEHTNSYSDLLRADGVAHKIGGLDRMVTLAHLLEDGNESMRSLPTETD
jgi:hypothetical protein